MGNDTRLTVIRQRRLAIHQLHMQRDRVDRLHYADRKPGVLRHAGVCRGIDLCARLTAKEHDAFVKYCETGNRFAGRERLAVDAVKIRHINRIISAVERNLLHVHLRQQQLGAAGPDAECVFQKRLAAQRRKNTQILHAVFISAAVKHLSRMHAYRFPNGSAALHRTRYHSVSHMITSLLHFEARFDTVYARFARL